MKPGVDFIRENNFLHGCRVTIRIRVIETALLSCVGHFLLMAKSHAVWSSSGPAVLEPRKLPTCLEKAEFQRKRSLHFGENRHQV